MATITYYVTYTVVMRNAVEYQFAVDYMGGIGNTFLINPTDAAAILGITFPYAGAVDNVNYIDVTQGSIFFPDLLVTEDDHFVAGTPSNPASIAPIVDRLYVWAGAVIFAPPSSTAAVPPTISRRRFIGGLEMLPTAEGGTNIVDIGSRDSSRTLEGLGYPIRGGNNTATWLRQLNEYQVGFTTQTSWERFYLRIRTLGTTDCGIWKAHGASSPNSGVVLKVTTTGTLQAVGVNAVLAETILGAVAITSGVWHKIDCLIRFFDLVTPGDFKVYIDGVLAMSFAAPAGGLSQNQTHGSSTLGKVTAAADTQVELDLDDWINADYPASLDGLDWVTGSHVARMFNSAGAAFTNWAMSNRFMLNQMRNPEQRLGSDAVSTTANALMDPTPAGISAGTVVSSATLREQIAYAFNLGAVAVVIGIESTNAANTDGTLGYVLPDGTIVDTTIDQTSVINTFNSVMYRPTGEVFPNSMNISLGGPFQIRHKKSNDVNNDTTRGMQCSAEFLGVWGDEDVDGAINPDIPRLNFQHNAYCANTLWGLLLGQPLSPVYAIGGTYVGNGTLQDLTTPFPAHFMWIRALTGGSTGVKWYGASLGAHRGTTDRIVPNYLLDSFIVAIGSNTLRIAGTDAEINAVGVTYQYIIFCDPGMRFNICGAYNRPSALATGQIALIDDTFLAEGGFVQNEVLASTSNTEGLSYKGPGHGANDGNQLNGTSIANWGSFATGILNTRSGIHYATRAQVNYSLFRSRDDCGYQMIQICSYTGNGAGGTRVITLTPTSLRTPMFALVMPHNAAAVFRDPSHTGANSCSASALSNTTTGITAGGVDSITVGTQLNANAIVYDVFVILGHETIAFANGSYFDISCINPEPWIPPTWNPPDIGVISDGGVGLGSASGSPLGLLLNVSGIYTVVDALSHDTLYQRAGGGAVSTMNVEIPDPGAKTGYIGG